MTEQGKRVTHVARDIGVSEATVRGWIRRYKEHGETAFPDSENLRPEDAEVKALKRPPSERKVNDEKLILEIKRIHKESYCTYGARRIKAQLNSDGIECGKNKVSKLMKENNISSKITRKYKATTYSNHNYDIAPNLLK